MHAAEQLSTQQITSVPVAIEWLRQVSRSDLDESIEYLKRLRGSVEMLEVYSAVFPGQYSASSASLSEPDREWPEYTAREGEFLRLLDKRNMIPIHLADEWEWLTERMSGIPVIPIQNYEWCCGDFDPEEFGDAFYLAFCVCTDQWEGASSRYQLDPAELYFGPGLDYRAFDEKLAREPDDLKFLPVLTDMMNYSTGNAFLDASHCRCPDFYPWTVKNIRRLALDYQRTMLIADGINRLDNLVMADPLKIYQRVRNIWNESLKEAGSKDEPVKD